MDPIDILHDLWEVWRRTGSELTSEQWASPTRCEGWDVAALYAHVAAGVGGVRALVADRRTEADVDHTGAWELMAAIKPDPTTASEVAEINADRAVADAERTGTEGLVARFRRGPETLAMLRDSRDARVEYFGHGVVPVPVVVEVRMVESTVHLLDLEQALPGAVVVPTPALDWVARALAAWVPSRLLVEAATGRTATNPFPVHA